MSVETLLELVIIRNEKGVDAVCKGPNGFVTATEAAKLLLLLEASVISARNYLTPYLVGSGMPELTRMRERDQAVFRAAMCDWIEDALNGKDVSDFADSFPEVHLAVRAGAALKREMGEGAQKEPEAS